jgi:hypothetical protein
MNVAVVRLIPAIAVAARHRVLLRADGAPVQCGLEVGGQPRWVAVREGTIPRGGAFGERAALAVAYRAHLLVG